MKLLSVLLFSATVTCISWDKLHDYSFEDFVQDFDKPYTPDSDEWKARKSRFEHNKDVVTRHNEAKERSYKLGVNYFSDMTEAEFHQYRFRAPHSEVKDFIPNDEEQIRLLESEDEEKSGKFERLLRRVAARVKQDKKQEKQPAAVAGNKLPDSIDWSDKKRNAMTNVHFQLGGSCWAHTAVEALESHAAIASGKPPMDLSVQELLACTQNPHNCGGTGGCNGAVVELAYDYVKKTGLNSLKNYPMPMFMQCAPGKCESSQPAFLQKAKKIAGGKVSLEGYTRLASNKYAPLMQALQKGPVAVAVSTDGWQHYQGGVLQCKNKDGVIGHAVLLVGYGQESASKGGKKYWKIRNSWGTSWGEDGYIRLERSDTEEKSCGTDHKPGLGTGCDGGPAAVTVCGACGILYDPVQPHGVKVAN